MSGPLRLTVAAMIATIGATLSLGAVFASNAWVLPVLGAVVLVSGSCALISPALTSEPWYSTPTASSNGCE